MPLMIAAAPIVAAVAKPLVEKAAGAIGGAVSGAAGGAQQQAAAPAAQQAPIFGQGAAGPASGDYSGQLVNLAQQLGQANAKISQLEQRMGGSSSGSLNTQG